MLSALSIVYMNESPNVHALIMQLTKVYREPYYVHAYGSQQQRMHHETFMVKRLEEYVQSRGYNAALIRYETVMPFRSNKCQSRVVLPGNGGTHEGEKCYTSITADESAACQAYIALVRHV